MASGLEAAPPLLSVLLQLLGQCQEGETVALKSLRNAQEDNRRLQEGLSGMQRALAQMENQKWEAERASLRLEKDKMALKRMLDKVEREKLSTREESLRLSAEKGRLGCSLTSVEQELAEACQQIRLLEILTLKDELRSPDTPSPICPGS
uniref:Uncharacterized protein n=1 Tax=Sphaerodactylus townsendi TaxID=933632 RepID=A0ACB8EEI4_9SAUR